MTISKSPIESRRQPRPGDALGRAWVAVATIPVFFFLGFALGYVLYDVLGYKPEDNDAPLWADLLATGPVLAVCLVPCVCAVVFGRRADRGGDRRGRVPLAVGALAGLAVTALTVVTTIADALA